jgi:phosphohistidine phosphatase SixA
MHLPFFSIAQRALACLAVLLALPGTASASAPDSTLYFIIRHAEKSAPNGDLPLSAEGRQRAAALAAMLTAAGVTHVFTTEMIRTRETAGVLVEQLKLTPKVVPVTQRDVLANELRQLPAGSVALVVNHSGTMPDLLQKLGVANPPAIEENQYDRMFVVVRSSGGGVHSHELRYPR